jgi:hypothetical protein
MISNKDIQDSDKSPQGFEKGLNNSLSAKQNETVQLINTPTGLTMD